MSKLSLISVFCLLIALANKVNGALKFDQYFKIKNGTNEGIRVTMQWVKADGTGAKETRKDPIGAGNTDDRSFKFDDLWTDHNNCDAGGTNCDTKHFTRKFTMTVQKKKADGTWEEVSAPSTWQCNVVMGYSMRKSIYDRWIDDADSCEDLPGVYYNSTKGKTMKITIDGHDRRQRRLGAPAVQST